MINTAFKVSPTVIFVLAATLPLYAGAVKVNDSNYATLSRGKPLVATLSLGCDLGSAHSAAFERTFKDVDGIQLGIIDYNSVSEIHSMIAELYMNKGVKLQDVALGTVLFIKDGKLLSTSKMPFPGRPSGEGLMGFTDERRWLIHVLESNGMTYAGRYRPPVADFVPADANGSAERVKEGRIAFYTFDDVKDTTGQQYDFALVPGARLDNGALYLDGEYNAKSTAFFVYKNKEDEPYKNGFTVSLNFRQLSTDKGRGFIAELGNSFVEIMNWNGTLTLRFDPTYQRGESGFISPWVYAIPGAVPTLKKWHNIMLSLDVPARRMRVAFNGRRLKDIALDDRFLEELAAYKPGSTFHGDSLGLEITNFSGGLVLHGHIDNLVLYNRPLNGAEMGALYREVTGNAPDTSEGNRPDQEKFNMALLGAAAKGDTTAVQTALNDGAEVNANYKGWTALHYAAYNGNEALVRLLLDKKADPLVKVQGHTAQSLAQMTGQGAVVALLENYSNSRQHFARRSFPLFQHRSAPMPPVIGKGR